MTDADLCSECLTLLQNIHRAADSLDATFIHRRKGLNVSGAADAVEITVDTYDNLRDHIMEYELHQADDHGVNR
jgi:hypothetical protein